jgi:hypothetical protein
MQSHQGMMHFTVKLRRDKTGLVPIDATAQRLIEEYLAGADRGFLRIQQPVGQWPVPL